jgi:hypothetical protein
MERFEACMSGMWPCPTGAFVQYVDALVAIHDKELRVQHLEQCLSVLVERIETGSNFHDELQSAKDALGMSRQ